MLDAAREGVKDALWAGLTAGLGLGGKRRPRFRGGRATGWFAYLGGVG